MFMRFELLPFSCGCDVFMTVGLVCRGVLADYGSVANYCSQNSRAPVLMIPPNVAALKTHQPGVVLPPPPRCCCPALSCPVLKIHFWLQLLLLLNIVLQQCMQFTAAVTAA